MGYLVDKYKGKYRLMAPITKDNQFQKKLDGTYEDIDIYIDCARGVKVYYFGRGLLEAYIPSIGMGRNIVKQIYYRYINPSNVLLVENYGRTSYKIIDDEKFRSDLSSNKNIIMSVGDSDEEVWFKFKSSDDDKILPLLKPKTSAANRSPFSSKNLPKSQYDIPPDDFEKYKKITDGFSMETGDWLKVSKITNDFIKSLANKRNKYEDIKSDMAKKGLKGKEYIHSIEKWNDYIKFLVKGLKNEN